MEVVSFNSVGWHNKSLLKLYKESIAIINSMPISNSSIRHLNDCHLGIEKIQESDIKDLESLLRIKDEEIHRLKSRNLIQRILNN